MKNEKLVKARKERKLTQPELAREIGVALVTLRKWEDGTRTPSSQCCDLLCQVLGKTATQLGLDDLPVQTTPVSPSLSERPTQGDENRKTMMKRVETFWISGVLNHSLSQGSLIHLYVQDQPDALLNPWAEFV